MADRELELREPYRYAVDEIGELAALIEAIDLASDQDTATWITRDGKRIAKIVPADEIRDGFDEWFTRFREKRHGWQADEVRTWLEAAWNAAPAGNHEILAQVMARQIEEIHRALGLERDEEGDPAPPDGFLERTMPPAEAVLSRFYERLREGQS